MYYNPHMAERIAEMGVPVELIKEFYEEVKRGEPLTEELKDGMFNMVFDLFYEEGVISDGDYLKLTFFADPDVSPDSYERDVYLYDAQRDQDGTMYAGELIAQSQITVMPDQFN